MPLQRRMIELQLFGQDQAAVAVTLESYLAHPQITPPERLWAMQELARVLIDRGSYGEAEELLAAALATLRHDSAAGPRGAVDLWRGEIHFQLGYCAWKLKRDQDAQRLLGQARQYLGVSHPLEARAACIMGQIHEQRGEPIAAIACFDAVLAQHGQRPEALQARFGRGLCRISAAQHEGGLSDLQQAMRQYIADTSGVSAYIDSLQAGLGQAAAHLLARQAFSGALDVLQYERQLAGKSEWSWHARVALARQRWAEQLESESTDAQTPQQARRRQQARELRVAAAEAQLASAMAMAEAGQSGYEPIFHAAVAQLHRFGDAQSVIVALENFESQRPADPLTPEVLLQLGQTCQTVGMLDKAIAVHLRNQLRYGQSSAALRSMLPLAAAYIERGPLHYAKAEKVLQSIIEGATPITPQMPQFTAAMLELGELYGRMNRFDIANRWLGELLERYPNYEPVRVQFRMAEYDRAAATAGAGATTELPLTDSGKSDAAHRLTQACQRYQKVISLLQKQPDLDAQQQQWLKSSYFRAADCLFDLRDYAAAIKQYEVAAARYQDEASALAAYVQIVNAHCAMNRNHEARAANERARALLRRLPAQAFSDGGFAMPRRYWEQWLWWSSQLATAEVSASTR
jgi:tetratricopeptide (TPR) repeat protein